MSFVGGNMGSAYTGREGFGKAFLLPEDDDALKAMGDLLEAEQDAKKLKLAKDKAKAAKKAKLKEAPEHWRIHSETIQGMTDDLFNLGSDLMSAGVDDPMTSTDPSSRQFQEYWSKLANMSNYSTQMKDQFQKDFQLMNAHPEKYTEESMNQNRAYYEGSGQNLKEYAENGTVAPRLIAKEDQIDLQKYMGEMAKNLGTNNTDPDFGDFKNMVSIGFNDPKNSGFKTALMDQLDHINKNNVRKAALEDKARANEVTPLEQLGIQQLESFFKTEPLDIVGELEKFIPKVVEYGTTYEDIAGTTNKVTGTKLPDEYLESSAQAFLDFNPKVNDQLIKADNGVNTKSEVKDYIKNLIKSRVKVGEKTALTREQGGKYGGRSYKEITEDMDAWYKALSSDPGDDMTQQEIFRLYNLAGNYLTSAELDDGTVISAFQPVQSDAKDMKMLLGEDYNPDLNPGSSDNYNPNILPFSVLGTETVKIQGKDKQGNKTTRNKEIKRRGKKYYDFENKGEMFPSKTRMEALYLAGLKARGYKLFSEMTDYEGTDKAPSESREKIVQKSKQKNNSKKQGANVKEKQGTYPMSGANTSGMPADKFTQ